MRNYFCNVESDLFVGGCLGIAILFGVEAFSDDASASVAARTPTAASTTYKTEGLSCKRPIINDTGGSAYEIVLPAGCPLKLSQ